MSKKMVVTATGGIRFSVAMENKGGREFLGHMEFGSLDEDGMYQQDDDEIIVAAREQYGIDEYIPAVVR